jgi:integrase
VGGRLVRRRTKTASSDAPLPLPALCSSALTAHRARQLCWIDSAGEAWHDHGLIVTTRYGEPVDPRNFPGDHGARGAAHVRLAARRDGRAPRVAMQVLRHSQIAVTMNVYSEVSTEDTREALRPLGERLSGEAL